MHEASHRNNGMCRRSPETPSIKNITPSFFLPAYSHLPSSAAARTLCIPHGRRLDLPLRSHPAPLWLAAATGPNNNVPLLDLHSLYRALKYASREDRRATETESLHAPLSRARTPRLSDPYERALSPEEMLFSLPPTRTKFRPDRGYLSRGTNKTSADIIL